MKTIKRTGPFINVYILITLAISVYLYLYIRRIHNKAKYVQQWTSNNNVKRSFRWYQLFILIYKIHLVITQNVSSYRVSYGITISIEYTTIPHSFPKKATVCIMGIKKGDIFIENDFCRATKRFTHSGIISTT